MGGLHRSTGLKRKNFVDFPAKYQRSADDRFDRQDACEGT
jgi:hypothetical protein